MMELLLFPLSAMGAVFIITPIAALFPTVFFLWLFRRIRSPIALLAGLMWLVYLPYEYSKYLRITCTGECNIRVDLLLIYPVLLLASLLALILAVRHYHRRRVAKYEVEK